MQQSLLRVLFLAAEAVPLIKVGGLADVAGALPKALRALGHDVRVVLPLHPTLRDLVAGTSPVASFPLNTQTGAQEAIVFQYAVAGLTYYLVDGPPLRAADAIYHFHVEQDAVKFVFFSLAALELTRVIGWKPNLVHANDWHTGAAVYWLRAVGARDPFFAEVATIITVHNLPYLGDGAEEALHLFNLSPDDRLEALPLSWLPDWARDALLPLALASADIITTVSPSYAAEILTSEFGCGMDRFLQTRIDNLIGILNGLDTESWDPNQDRALAARFDLRNLDRREKNKKALQRQFGFSAQTGTPLLGIVSRLDHQKGLDLALTALSHWAEQERQAVVLGTGTPELESQYRELSERYPKQIAVTLEYNAALASRIYAGADMLLMPSRYEPCGLSQMIAMRYGCVPVVHAVGGLRDTVRDVDLGSGTGFAFSESQPGAITDALDRAGKLFLRQRRWQAIQRRAMRQDFSWLKAARAYSAAYHRAIALHSSRSRIYD